VLVVVGLVEVGEEVVVGLVDVEVVVVEVLVEDGGGGLAPPVKALLIVA
jgi:hypothetical protein